MKRFFLFFCLFAQALWANDGLKISGAGDLLFESTASSRRLDVREAEFLFYGPADPYFDFLFSAAAHREGTSIPDFEIHELYLKSSRLIPRSRFKVGQFFLGVGRLNQIHRHDWPFIAAPLSHQNFFAEEAAVDTGIEYSYLLPVSFYLDLTAGLTNGWTFGHSHSIGNMAMVPTHYLRAMTFQSFGGQDGVQIALNYLGNKNSADSLMLLFGVDAVAKWKEDKTVKTLLQSEVWFKNVSKPGTTTSQELGGYFFSEFALSSEWFFGPRLDFYSELSRQQVGGAYIRNLQVSLVPTLTLKLSEFSKFRLASEISQSYADLADATTNWKIQAQAVFLLGAHPSHDF